MDRTYENGADSSKIRFFVGKELEHTPMFGALTLFVVGNETTEEIDKRLKLINNDPKRGKINHIYFAANHSYLQFTQFWQLSHYLNLGYNVTYENTADGYSKVQEHLPNHKNFIVMLSVIVPNIAQTKGHIIIKLDDKDVDRTNAGVWCINARDITQPKHFTSFEDYSGDEILE